MRPIWILVLKRSKRGSRLKLEDQLLTHEGQDLIRPTSFLYKFDMNFLGDRLTLDKWPCEYQYSREKFEFMKAGKLAQAHVTKTVAAKIMEASEKSFSYHNEVGFFRYGLYDFHHLKIFLNIHLCSFSSVVSVKLLRDNTITVFYPNIKKQIYYSNYLLSEI